MTDGTDSFPTPFAARHIGPEAGDADAMLARLGVADIDALIDAAVPRSVRTDRPLKLPEAEPEHEVLGRLSDIASTNEVRTSLIGLGFHGTHTPAVITRNLLENPAWYTAYTPYQAEISQGRLEALLNFQTMIADLTGLPVANASLLDEASAAAEAMGMCQRLVRGDRDRFVVDADTHPRTVDVIRTRAEPLGIRVDVVDDLVAAMDEATFGVLVSYPGSSGQVRPIGPVAEAAHAVGALCVAAADPLALCLLASPGSQGADIAIGTTQRFGVPLWAGGPHAAYIATADAHTRTLPGRLVGVSIDANGERALRLALQTREQHIRREKATSNVCTAQALLAIAASMYAVYHGPDGLADIARRVHGAALTIARSLAAAGFDVVNATRFDTVTVRVADAGAIHAAAAAEGLNLRPVDQGTVAVTTDETTSAGVVERVLRAFGAVVSERPAGGSGDIPDELVRTEPFCTHPVFSAHRSETAMMRYLRRLADKDLALDRTSIPLGSCTMKLNAAVEMIAISWRELTDIHPYAPVDQQAGYARIVADLEEWLAEITGYDAVSLQPNAGSQGELAGLLAIRAYHLDRGDDGRDVCLIPTSAHGTNAASAVMAGMRVVSVACDDNGNVDVDDLGSKLDAHGESVAALMVTYPSTHGVFEEAITEICDLVHDAGGQVYLDGANLNAMVGLARPGAFGADVSHLNLHKTFCIPHGGGGPGVGPVAVRAHLAPFLPADDHAGGPGDTARGGGAVTSAPWGSPGVLPISWAYIALMGGDGLTDATKAAILGANYVAARLDDRYPVLYRGAAGWVAHECIIDLRPITKATGVTAEDVAKRLIDHGIHAPTMAFPVAGTLMVEPTESEPLAELDRFCDAMEAIRDEIAAIERGDVDVVDSALRHAPHTAEVLLADEWDRAYTRSEAAYPGAVVRGAKYWPPVGRIDNPHGDRNLMCVCPPLEDLAEA